MARPRVFVSSTYYDLRHIRQGLELFIREMGYEPILFESGDIPFSHDKPLDESCYREIATCQMLVLIIGGRFGSAASSSQKPATTDELEKLYAHYNSITQKEYQTALGADMPVFTFVEKGVHVEYDTFKKNRKNESIAYAHVDSVNIFRLLDGIYALTRNNVIREFDKVTDITVWLRDQWAGLFAEMLSKRGTDRQLATMAVQLERLQNVAETLRSYSESIMRDMDPAKAETVIKDMDDKLLEKNRLDDFARSVAIKHLVDFHDADVNKLYSVFVSATSFADMLIAFDSLMEDHCGIHHMSYNELAELRDKFSLPPFTDAAEMSAERQYTGIKAKTRTRT